MYQHWVVGCNVSTVKTCTSWRLDRLLPFAVSSLGLMMVFILPMTEQSLYQGFGVGLTWNRRLRAQALPHSCCTMSKHIQLWEDCPVADQGCHRHGRGPVVSLLLPAAITAQRKSQDRSTSTSPQSLPGFHKAMMGVWIFPCPFPAQGIGGN